MMASVMYTNNPAEIAGAFMEILVGGELGSKVGKAREACGDFH